MKITINPRVLSKENITLGEYLVLLMGYHNIEYEQVVNSLVEKGLADRNVHHKNDIVLSDNVKNRIANIITKSDDRIICCGVNFERLAVALQMIYPGGVKAGTTYEWRGTTEEIAQKLRTLVVKYDFCFTEQEAIEATKEYVSSFKNTKYMHLLKYFILKTTDDGSGHKEIDSVFMSIIENNRENGK